MVFGYRFIFPLLILTSLAACGLLSSKPNVSSKRGSAKATQDAYKQNALPAALASAEKLLKEEKFSEAILLLEPMKKENEGATASFRLLLYRLGQSYEGAQKYSEAITSYRALLNLSLTLNEKDQAEVLYRLVSAYEGAGNDIQELATLKDLEKRRRVLSKEFVEYEIPARYAMIYTRLGDLKNADAYYKKFSSSIKLAQKDTAPIISPLPTLVPTPFPIPEPSSIPSAITTDSHPAAPDTPEPAVLPPTLTTDSGKQVLVPRLLYNIGHLSSRRLTLEELKMGHPALSHAQAFLLQAVQAGDTIWSPKAAAEIVQIYRDALDVINAVQAESTPDPVVGLIAQQETKKELAGKILKKIGELRVRREALSKEGKESSDVGILFSRLDELDDIFTAIVNERPVQEGLTDESKKREGLKRNGRIVDPTKEEHPKQSIKKPDLHEEHQ